MMPAAYNIKEDYSDLETLIHTSDRNECVFRNAKFTFQAFQEPSPNCQMCCLPAEHPFPFLKEIFVAKR